MSGPNSILNSFIESTKDDWDIGRELPTGDIICDPNKRYNNMVERKEWTKTDPKDSKILSLTTHMSKLEKKNFFP